MTDRVDLDKLRELAEKASWPRTDPGAIDNYGSLVVDNHLLVEILDERAEALARLAKVEALEAARLRDAAHPEYVPESVTDAGFASQAHWWKPGDEPIQGVYVAQLIEQIAEAAYRATIAAQSVGEPSRE